jgi:hypothetical protein
MSKDSKLTRVKMILAKNPKLNADTIVKQMDVTKVYAYNLLSSARKALGMKMQHDGSWKLKERMLSSKNRPEGMTDRDIEEIVADVEQSVAQYDAINHPPHYNTGGIEVIDFIEAKSLSYHLGNVIKYIARADHKGDRLENLKKAKWYLEREIAKSAK